MAKDISHHYDAMERTKGELKLMDKAKELIEARGRAAHAGLADSYREDSKLTEFSKWQLRAQLYAQLVGVTEGMAMLAERRKAVHAEIEMLQIQIERHEAGGMLQ